MKNGFVHDEVLLHPAEVAFQTLGAKVRREVSVRVYERLGSIDLLVESQSWRIAVEAETVYRRAGWDIDKAAAANADGLTIIVPNGQVARACWREIHRKLGARDDHKLWISVLTPGAFRRWFDFDFALFSTSFEASKIRKSIGSPVDHTTKTLNPKEFYEPTLE